MELIAKLSIRQNRIGVSKDTAILDESIFSDAT